MNNMVTLLNVDKIYRTVGEMFFRLEVLSDYSDLFYLIGKIFDPFPFNIVSSSKSYEGRGPRARRPSP
jgi:hypothetical protein